MRVMGVTASVVGVREFAAEVSAVPLARQWMRHGLVYGPHVPAGVLDDTEQCLVELVTNSVVHGTRPRAGACLPGAAFVHVTVVDVGDGVRVEVIDQGADCKRPALAVHMPGAFEVHGRGLLIVDSLSRCWSFYDDEHGRTTFCEIAY